MKGVSLPCIRSARQQKAVKSVNDSLPLFLRSLRGIHRSGSTSSFHLPTRIYRCVRSIKYSECHLNNLDRDAHELSIRFWCAWLYSGQTDYDGHVCIYRPRTIYFELFDELDSRASATLQPVPCGCLASFGPREVPRKMIM